MTDNSTSGILGTPQAEVSTAHFKQMTTLSSTYATVITKAKRNGRWWVLKSLGHANMGQRVYEEMLLKEFDILQSLQHPGIVTALDIEQVTGLGLCLVMEWVDGMTLKQWMEQPHSRNERLSIAMQLADALDYIHQRQTAHRDLKPANIMVTRNGQRVKLIDFGLSDTDSHAILKQPAGTAGYMSPEQSGCNKTDIRNDIYSLGCILDELHLGWQARRIVARCTALADRRYQDVRQVRAALGRIHRLPMTVTATAAILVAVTVITVLAVGQANSNRRNDEMSAVVDSLGRQLEAANDLNDSLRDTVSMLSASYEQQMRERQVTEKRNAAIDKALATLEQLMGAKSKEIRKDVIASPSRYYELLTEFYYDYGKVRDSCIAATPFTLTTSEIMRYEYEASNIQTEMIKTAFPDVN